MRRRVVAFAGGLVLVLALWLTLRHSDDKSSPSPQWTGSARKESGRAVVERTVSGRVMRSDGSGIPGAVVSLSRVGARQDDPPPIVQTGQTGEWSIIAPATGHYVVAAAAVTFLPAAREVDIVGALRDVDLEWVRLFYVALDGSNSDHLTSFSVGRFAGSGLGISPSA